MGDEDYLELSDGSGKLAASQVQGNSGKFIVRLIRTRTDSVVEPKIITKSLWQIVKAVPGTWLTSVAKHGLSWPDEDLPRVYVNEFVQACEPGPDDTKPPYHFFNFEEGGRWEDGIHSIPKKAGARDLQVQVDSYWGFKLEEIVVYQKPELGTDELSLRRKKMMDVLFEEALALDDKKNLSDELNRLEQAAKAVGQTVLNEEQKLAELNKVLEEVREKVRKHTVDPDVADAIEGWFQFVERSLMESLKTKGSMERRIDEEIKYLMFRSAEYDLAHDQDQEVERVQKGTPEENRWEKILPILPLKTPEDKKRPYKPGPSTGSSSGPRPSV